MSEIGLDSALIGTLYRAACLAELDALKPGNVHAHAPGHRMVLADFVTSADVSARPLARAGAGVGTRVRDGVAATMAAVGQNTNLGILLLCAPLAVAAERGRTVASVLDTLDGADAEAVFAGIRRANPGGLGEAARHDVAEPAPGSLRDAMAEAADRDRIARAYVTGFADVPAIGLAALREARTAGLDPTWCTTAIHLAFLRAVPDSHVARKHGAAAAEGVRREVEATLAGIDLAARPVDALLALDASLKGRSINPGTSADFTVATLFWDALAGAGARLA
ncbi:triphosphoribosyl-dephospho-CoA synthase [Methylobacterium radiotolerans]|jgi:triphosphoribosyl-dephospho-CoA synthase|uniref:triphosphoribosyl-dephospho-CoA synthase n=1 Tax=Methylobacterium TaxID=407 RepID=UPI0005E5DD3C|nr:MULTISPECIES: triphosphoribosyl-dephospho-CoA synthase [Methylobacterium]MBN6820470.1 triphosphoribosyl-dephospho-CoA synthase [Methylobacterium organophilum]OXE42513.1 triphosphoribosyl-dephospho-CoA synthase [Methylobacterium radiotolerans]GAN47143.1 triphosphoribosyl-dephospho-CoA protein [Methylobacterium sp. ME121]